MLYANVVQDARSPASLYKNQATGGFSNQRDPIIDTDAMYAHYFETWGRKVEYEFVLGSGADEAAQRADAVAVAAKKPFAVFDAAIQGGNQSTGGLIFETEVQARGRSARARHRWRAAAVTQGSVEGRRRERGRVRGQVARGKKAEYGGADVKDKTRSFGILYQAGTEGFDIDYFKQQFTKNGGKLAVAKPRSPFPPGTSQADAADARRRADAHDDGQAQVDGRHHDHRGARLPATVCRRVEGGDLGRVLQPEWMIGSGGPTGGGAFPTDLDIILARSPTRSRCRPLLRAELVLPPYVTNPVTRNPFRGSGGRTRAASGRARRRWWARSTRGSTWRDPASPPRR